MERVLKSVEWCVYGGERFGRCSYAIRTGLILVWIINSLIRHLPDILGGVFYTREYKSDGGYDIFMV